MAGAGAGLTAHKGQKLRQGQEQERRILLAGSSTQTVRSQARITEQQLMMNITSGTNCILKRNSQVQDINPFLPITVTPLSAHEEHH